MTKSESLGRYLGAHFSGYSPNKQDFKKIMQKNESRIALWQANFSEKLVARRLSRATWKPFRPTFSLPSSSQKILQRIWILPIDIFSGTLTPIETTPPLSPGIKYVAPNQWEVWDSEERTLSTGLSSLS